MRTFSSPSFYMLMVAGAATAGLSLSAAINRSTLGAAMASLPTSMQYRGSGRATPDPALMPPPDLEMSQGHRGSGRITPGPTHIQSMAIQSMAGHRGSGRAPADTLTLV